MYGTVHLLAVWPGTYNSSLYNRPKSFDYAQLFVQFLELPVTLLAVGWSLLGLVQGSQHFWLGTPGNVLTMSRDPRNPPLPMQTDCYSNLNNREIRHILV